jgi:hypothetical protein
MVGVLRACGEVELVPGVHPVPHPVVNVRTPPVHSIVQTKQPTTTNFCYHPCAFEAFLLKERPPSHFYPWKTTTRTL